jgi:hypothetical protein
MNPGPQKLDESGGVTAGGFFEMLFQYLTARTL